MLVWSKALAVALSATLLGFGATAVQAKDHDKAQSCPAPQTCPAPVLEKPAPISGPCCQIPEVQQRCPQTGCCVVDQGYVSKEEKEALKKRHDAVKAFQKQQKAVEKANRKIEERYAKEQRRIDKANAHLNHEVAEFMEVNGPSEAVAAATPVQPEPEIERTKPMPEPEPAPIAQQPTPQPTPQVTEEQVTIAQVTPETPAPAPVEKPKALPKTASELNLIGLLGLVSTMTGYMTRFFRS